MHIEVAIDISDPTTALPFYAEVLGYRSSHVDNMR
jgi:predicted enzyme related to lactoylglutathione lyase